MQKAPALDGQVAPDEWAGAASIDSGKITPATRIRMMFDDANLYIAAECDLPAAQTLPPPPGQPIPRDAEQTWKKEDCIEMWIRAGVMTGRSFQFVLSSSGAICDLGGGNQNYNPEWKHAVSINKNSAGWTAEMAIPKAALELSERPAMSGPVVSGVEPGEWPGRMAFNIGRNGPYVKMWSWTGSYGDLSGGKLKLEGVPEVEAKAEKTDDQSAGGTGVLVTKAMRKFARPGDRWIEIGVEMPGLKPPLDKYRLEASLFKLGDLKPVAQSGAAPTLNKGTVLVDLRSLDLDEARLCLTLMEGRKALGSSEMFLAAKKTEQPIKAGEKVKVLLDVPAGIKELENWPVTFGVPFAAGTLWDVNQMRLVDKKGKEIPCQVEATGLWAKEGAVKWARVDALVSPEQECFVEVFRKGSKSTPKPELKVSEKDGKITIDTGAATYMLGKGNSPIMEIAHRACKKVATGENPRTIRG